MRINVDIIFLNTYSDSPNWVVFQPNIVIDAKLGEFSHSQSKT